MTPDPMGALITIALMYVLGYLIMRRLTSPLRRLAAFGRRDRTLPPVITACLLIYASETTLTQLALEGPDSPPQKLLATGALVLVAASAALAFFPKSTETVLGLFALIAGYQQVQVVVGHAAAAEQLLVAAPAVGLFMFLRWARTGNRW